MKQRVLVLSLAIGIFGLAGCGGAEVPNGPTPEEIAEQSAREANLSAEYNKIESVDEMVAIYSKAPTGSLEKKVSLKRFDELLLIAISNAKTVKEANKLLLLAPLGTRAKPLAMDKVREFEQKE